VVPDEPREGPPRRRILLAIDATTHSATVEAAVELAARMHAEIVALFLEDEELLRVVDYPHTRYVALTSGEHEAVDSQVLAKQLRRVADTLERTLERATRRFGVAINFQIVRGRVAEVMVSQSAEVDMVFVDRGSHTYIQYARGSVAGSGLLERLGRPVLVWGSPSLHPGPVFVVLGRGDEPGHVLSAAVRLGGGGERDLVVLLADDDALQRDLLREGARAWLEHEASEATFYRLEKGSVEDLERAARELGAELVVVSAEWPRRSETMARWLEMTDRPVFLVR
jgi:hypothetical protein